MAEVDDGDFGDFKFAPTPPNPTNQINGWSATDNDDEWGDFFSNSPNKTLSNSHSLPSFPEASPTAGKIDPGKKLPSPRRQGALPLSLFGEEEETHEEQQSGTFNSSFAFFSPKTGDSMRKSSSVNASLGLNDLIGSLYDQSPQIKPQNRFDSKTDFKTNEMTADSSLFGDASLLPPKTGGSDVSLASNDLIGNLSDQIKPQNGLDVNTKEPITGTIDTSVGSASLLPPKAGDSIRKTSSWGVGLTDSIANSYYQSHQIEPDNGLKLETNVSSPGTGADAGLPPKPSNSMRKSSSLNVVDGLNDLFGSFYDESHPQNGFSSNSNGLGTVNSSLGDDASKASSLNADVGSNDLFANFYDQAQNGLDQKANESITGINGPTAADGNEHNEKDEDDDGWEFKVAEAESGARYETSEMKVVGNGQQSSGRAENTCDIGNGTQGTNDLFGTPVRTSNKSGDWDFEFDYNPKSVAQDGTASSFSENKPNNAASGTNWSPSGDKPDSDEFIWEFKDASSEVGSKHKSKEPKVADVLPTGKALAVGNTANGSNVSKAASDMVGHGSLDFRFSSNPSTPEGGSNSYNNKQTDIVNGPVSSVDANIKYDKNLWGLNDSFPETGSKHGTIVDEKQELREKGLDSGVTSSQNGGLDHSTFSPQSGGDDFGQNSWEFKGVSSGTKAEDQNLKNGGDDFGQNSWEFKGEISGTKAEEQTSVYGIQKDIENGPDPTKNMFSSVSVNDDDDDFGVDSWEFLGALPGTSAKEQTYINDGQKLCENGSESICAALQPNLVNDHDNLWDFKDVSSGSKVENKSSDLSSEDSFKRHSTTLELDKYLYLYGKLKDELCYITECHLTNLKKNQSNDALSGEDVKDKAPSEDIQEFYNELHQENIELHLENISESNSCMNELLEVLKEPKFQMLESEYHISERLLVASKDLRSAVSLLKHVILTLKILRLGSPEGQFNYVSTWQRVLSVCAEKLEHGASIWNQSLQKNIHNQILSRPQGKIYIVGLGEIYRVVEVLGASAKLYKPWILLYSPNPTALFALVNKCCTLWSSSGIEEALNTISDPIDFGYDGTISGLQASIKSIHDLDELTLQKLVLPQQEPICRLSLLSPDTALGMKLVVWDQEHYFLKVANLWANLVSHNPPNLPHVHG